MPSGTLPSAGSLGDANILTGDYQTQINQLLAYVRSLQTELASLSGTQIKEGAVRAVGTGLSDLVQTSRLNTRLATTGNLGSAAVADIGTASGNVVDSARIEVLADSTLAIPDGDSNGPSFSDPDLATGWIGCSALCTTDSGVDVIFGESNPPAGKAGVYVQTVLGSRVVQLVNNSGANNSFRIVVYQIEFA